MADKRNLELEPLPFSVRLTVDQRQRLDTYAKKQRKHLSEVVREFLDEALDKREVIAEVIPQQPSATSRLVASDPSGPKVELRAPPSAPTVRDERVALAHLAFHLSDEVVRIDSRLAPSAEVLVAPILRELSYELSRRFETEISVVGGFARLGSITYKDGTITISSRTLAALLAGYTFIGGYVDFRSGLTQMHADVTTVVTRVLKTYGAEDVTVVPANPDQLEQRLVQFLDLGVDVKRARLPRPSPSD